MRRLPRRSAKRRRGLPCASCRSRARSSRRCWSMHRARDLLVRQRTQLINALRGHLAEFGLIEAQGPSHVRRLLAGMRTDLTVPELARETLDLLATALEAVDAQIDAVEAKITTWHKANPTSQRLATIPGIGPLIASAITATVADPAAFRSGREFPA